MEDSLFYSWIWNNFPKGEREKVIHTWRYAFRAHFGQLRRTGRPFICHPEEVAIKVKELGLPVEYVMAGLLHDVTEDCLFTLLEIYFMFGPGVSLLVHFMDKTKLCLFDDYATKSSVFFETDPRTVLLRLADSLANLKEATGFSSPRSRKRAAWNALDLLEVAPGLFLDSSKYVGFFEEVRKEAEKYAY